MQLEDFEKCSVKELRRHAALRSVPLTQISAALEKKDLINLILHAGPVKNQYDVGNFKVHSAESIAHEERSGRPRVKEKKKKKKKRKSTSSSSRSSSSGKKKKRSRSRKAIKGRRKKSRSPSVTMIIPTITIGRPEKPVLEIADTSMIAVPSAINTPVKRKSAAEAARAKAAAAAPKKSDPNLAQRGMAAAAALGYDVLPKGPREMEAPAIGLRPSINSKNMPNASTAAMMSSQGLTGSRICTNYLCYSRCDMGANCPEAHVVDPEEEMRVRAKFKEQECNKGATCNRKGCLFRHPGELREEHTFVPAGQGVAVRNIGGVMQIEWQ